MRLRISLLGAVVIVTAFAPSAQAAKRCNNAHLTPSAANLERAVGATLCLINKERTRRGRKALRHDAVLHVAAVRYARQMVRQNFFDHVEPDGDDLLDRIKRTTYLDDVRGYHLGENIAWGSGSLATPRETVRAWIKSPGHKRNMLSPKFTELGVGIAVGAPVRGGPADAATYTTEFGTRK